MARAGPKMCLMSNPPDDPYESVILENTPTVELDPETTLVVIIDPQRGFSAPSGTFGRVFGAEELGPLREALKELALFLNSLPKEVSVVLVLSEYPRVCTRLGQQSSLYLTSAWPGIPIAIWPMG